MKLINIYSKILYILFISLSYNQGFIFNSHENFIEKVIDDKNINPSVVNLIPYVENKGFESVLNKDEYFIWEDVINDGVNRPLFIAFWFKAAAPCAKQLHKINLIKNAQNDNVDILSINTDNARLRSEVKKYLRDKSYPFITLSDINARYLKKIGGDNMPYLLLVDTSGIIVREYVGYNIGDEIQYKNDLEQLLDGSLERDTLNEKTLLDQRLKLLDHPFINRNKHPDKSLIISNKKKISIGYQFGFYRDTETIEAVEDSLVIESSYKKELELIFTFKDKYDLSFNISNINNSNNGYITNFNSDYLLIKNTYYFHEKFSEEFIDQKNGIYDKGENFTDLGNGIWDNNEPFTDVENGKYDVGEVFFDKVNGKWDPGEEFEDLNNNGEFDVGEKYTDIANGIWDENEEYIDRKNGKWDEGEEFIDLGNGIYDESEIFVDEANGKWDADETFTDSNNNNRYDKGFPIGFMLHFNLGASMPIEENLMRFSVFGFGINKKMEYKNYPIFPSISFMNYSGYFNESGSRLEFSKSQIVFKCPLQMKIEEETSSSKSPNSKHMRGLWIAPSITLNEKDSFFGLQFGIYRKF